MINEDLINKCTQGSDQWHKDKLSFPSSSNFSKIITPTGKPSKSSVLYQDKLLAEYILGESEDSFSSKNMDDGVEREPDARFLYECAKDLEITEVGMVYLNDDKNILCSPDGLIKIDGEFKKGLEIKCPKLNTQLKRLREGVLPSEYMAQVQGSMWITGFKTWDFISYHPKFKPFLITVERDENFIADLEISVLTFSAELERLKKGVDQWKSQ